MVQIEVVEHSVKLYCPESKYNEVVQILAANGLRYEPNESHDAMPNRKEIVVTLTGSPLSKSWDEEFQKLFVSVNPIVPG